METCQKLETATSLLTTPSIILDIITVKFDIQVDDRTITQSTLLHDNIPGYNLLTLEFMLLPVNDNEDLILEEENPEIYVHLENVLVHMIDTQDIAIFKSQKDYIRKKQTFGIHTLCSKVASLVSHILLCGLYMQHYTCANTDRILYKIPKDNASNAYGIYNHEHK